MKLKKNVGIDDTFIIEMVQGCSKFSLIFESQRALF